MNCENDSLLGPEGPKHSHITEEGMTGIDGKLQRNLDSESDFQLKGSKKAYFSPVIDRVPIYRRFHILPILLNKCQNMGSASLHLQTFELSLIF